MRRRRGRGEGAIYRRADGQWCTSVTIGYDERGRRRRRTLYGPTKGAVVEKLAKLQSAIANGTLAEVQRTTLAQFLHRWLENAARLTIRPATYRLYSGIIRNHINPHLGGVQLSKVSPQNVQAMYTAMERAGRSPRLRQLAHAVLHRALGQALKWGMILRNPCDAVDKPKAPRPPIKFLTPEQVKILLDAAAEDRLGALYVLAVASGMRQGELLGLQVDDVNLKDGAVTVSKQLSEDAGVLELTQPKTDKGRRRIELPRFAVDALREHRKRMLAEGNPRPWLFCDSEGNPLRKSNLLRRSFWPLLKKAGLPRIRFHDLRHTAATLLFAEGVHPKIVQERLGHAQISLTLDTYSHVLPSMQKEAAAKLDRLIGSTERKATGSVG